MIDWSIVRCRISLSCGKNAVFHALCEDQSQYDLLFFSAQDASLLEGDTSWIMTLTGVSPIRRHDSEMYAIRDLSRRLRGSYVIYLPDNSRVRASVHDTHVGGRIEEIYYKRVYEREFLIASRSVVIDIGANIGIFAIRASRLVGPQGRIISIEPENENFKFLQENVNANKLGNITAIDTALGKETGVKTLYVYRQHGSTSFFPRNDAELESTREVKVRTLDDVVDDLKLNRVDFVKIDTEGFELEILQGGIRTLNKFKPNLALETHPIGPSLDETRQFLIGAGYLLKTEETFEGYGILYATPQ